MRSVCSVQSNCSFSMVAYLHFQTFGPILTPPAFLDVQLKYANVLKLGGGVGQRQSHLAY